MTKDHFLRALQDNPAIVAGIKTAFEHEREKILERLANAKGEEILYLQGEARLLRRAISELPKWLGLRVA